MGRDDFALEIEKMNMIRWALWEGAVVLSR